MDGMTTDKPQAVQVDKTEHGITTITINRFHRRNAIDGPTAKELTDAFLAFEADPTQKVCVFHGANGTFCAGFDLHEVAKYHGAESSSGALACRLLTAGRCVCTPLSAWDERWI